MKHAFWAFVICLLAVAAGAAVLRLPRLDVRPMHGDEANQAAKAGILLETGVYRYDPRDHHGPSLYYLTLPSLGLARARTFAETTEFDFRVVPVVFGVGLVLLVWLVADGIGRHAALAAAALTAISPAMVFYSRFYIQETLLVFFTVGLIGSAWRYVQTQRRAWLVAAGACAGLMAATKETWVLAAAAMLAALAAVVVWKRWGEGGPVRLRPLLGGWRLVDGLLVAGLVAAMLFSSFFTNARGPLDAISAYGLYLTRAGGAGLHDNPWYFYLGMLANSRWVTGATSGPWWSEGLILGLGLIGMVAAVIRRGLAEEHVPLARFLGLYTIVLAVLYAAIPYKTPWCALGFLHGMILMAGVGTVAVVHLFRTCPFRYLIFLGVAALAVQLGWQAWRASFKYAADQRNPYVYAHTSPDVLNLARCVEDVAALSPHGHDMIVKVITGENYWPLPWYLRRFNADHVGYYHEVPDDPEADVIIVGADVQEAVDLRLRELHEDRVDAACRRAGFRRRMSIDPMPPALREAVGRWAADAYNRQCMFALRPQVFMRVYVSEDLWNALMDRRSGAKPQ